MIAGIQVSSFKPLLTTEPDMRAVFNAIARMGCTTVQLQWIDPSIPPEAIAAALDETGLRSVSTQDFTTEVLEHPDYYLRLNKLTGGRWVCISRIPAAYRTRDGLDRFARELQRFARELDVQGLALCFHPVAADYEPVEGMDPVQYLADALPAEELALCLDLYHVHKAGLDLGATIRSYAGRVCMVHFKDFHVVEGEEELVPAGQGSIPWGDAIAACRETNVPYGFVEQERWDRDPYACLGEAYTWLEQQL